EVSPSHFPELNRRPSRRCPWGTRLAISPNGTLLEVRLHALDDSQKSQFRLDSARRLRRGPEHPKIGSVLPAQSYNSPGGETHHAPLPFCFRGLALPRTR